MSSGSGSHIIEVGPGFNTIDLVFRDVSGVIASYLLAGDDDLTLIETGPTTTIDSLLAGIREAGFEPEQVRKILVTHIHLDHAGAAGVFMRDYPNAKLYVHRKGAAHMTDPARLLDSAARIYGDQMVPLWGEVAGVPEDRVELLDDGTTVMAAGRELIAVDTPGHAGHHMSFLDAVNGDLFTGDIGGVRLGSASYVRPPTVPPEFDYELWQQSITKLRLLQPKRLFPTHFGGFDDPEWHFDDLLTRLGNWTGWTEAQLQHGVERDALIDALRAKGDAELQTILGSEELANPYDVATAYYMTVDGLLRYFRKRERRS